MRAFLAPRDFECIFCGQTFSQLSGDLMVPGPDICDACLETVWSLDDDALRKHVAHHLCMQEQGIPGMGKGAELETNIVHYIQDLKQRYDGLDALLQERAA